MLSRSGLAHPSSQQPFRLVLAGRLAHLGTEVFRRTRYQTLIAPLLLLAACGGSDSPAPPAPPPGGGGGGTSEVTPRPVTPDPEAWSRYFVSSFNEEVVSAVRRTAAFADHAIRISMRITGHPEFGGPGQVIDINPLVEARIEYAHSVGLTGAGQIVSMLDSAPRTSHEQFAGKPVYLTGSGPVDGHGTGVASLMVGTGGSGTSIGVAPGAGLHAGILDFASGSAWSELARMMRDAHGLGAVASNNSWMIPSLTAANTNLRSYFEQPGRYDYIRALREFTETGVVVFAASNEYYATSASGLAALPTAFPDLEGRWLAVVNAIPELTDDRILSASRVSAACLEAARWCLTANGQARVASEEGDTHYALGSGTSFAAPQVSGSIALLAEAFPTLTAGQLRDRMLATADNSFFSHTNSVTFAPGIVHGYNEEFGHGFLDLRAALLPIGDHVIPTASGGTRSFGEIALISGGASGDAVEQALAAARIISLDGLHGIFETDARHLVATRTAQHDRTMMMARATSRTAPSIFHATETHSLDGGLVLPEFLAEIGSLRLTLPSGGAEVTAASFRRQFDAGPGTLTLGLRLGSQSDGVLGLRIPAAEGRLSGRTASAILGYDMNVGATSRLSFETEFGIASARAGGMIDSISGVRFNAFNIRYTIGGIATPGDSLSLSVSQPTALNSGQATVTLPVAMSGGSPIFEPVAFGLAPMARQLDLAIEYTRPINRRASLRLGAMYSANHGHRAGARDVSAVLGLSVRF